MGGDIYGVNAEYACRDHSWYAILSFFFSPPPVSSLIPLTFISDPCSGVPVVQDSTRTTACSLPTAHADSATQHPCSPPMASCVTVSRGVLVRMEHEGLIHLIVWV